MSIKQLRYGNILSLEQSNKQLLLLILIEKNLIDMMFNSGNSSIQLINRISKGGILMKLGPDVGHGVIGDPGLQIFLVVILDHIDRGVKIIYLLPDLIKMRFVNSQVVLDKHG